MKWFKHYVYFFSTKPNKPNEQRYLKIGRSKNWHARYWELNTVTPFGLYVRNVLPFRRVYDAVDCEHYFHRLYKQWRVNGEWFRLNDQLKKELAKDYINAREKLNSGVNNGLF